MGDTRLKIKPGVEIQSTPYQTGLGLNDSQLIRHHQGYIQKLGGWARLSNSRTVGTPRGMQAFIDLDGNKYIAYGTELTLGILNGVDLYDITPLRATSDLTGPFTTVAASSTVQVTDPAHAASVGDLIYIATAAYVDGIILQGLYTITNVIDANNYEFDSGQLAIAGVSGGGDTFQFTTTMGSPTVAFTLGAATFATDDVIFVYVSTAVGGLTIEGSYTLDSPTTFQATAAGSNDVQSENGGDVEILYYISSSPDPTSPFVYGAGYYGMGPYGVGTGSNSNFYLRQWSMDAWGEILLAAPWKGPLYQWAPPIATGNRATVVSNAPEFNTQILIAMPQQQVVSFGSDAGGYLDPLLVRWSDVSDYSSSTAWTALVTNQAGSFRIPRGSMIIGARQASVQILIWTDIGLWSMQYVQPPLVYGFNEVGTNCGLVNMRATQEMAGVIYWMGNNGFFRFNGNAVETLPCAVWDFAFNNLDRPYGAAIFAAPNSDFTEVAWFFPMIGDVGATLSYVKYNVAMGLWDKGTLPRSSWIDRSGVAAPTGAEGNDGYLQEHEVSTDADGEGMVSSLDTGLMPLDDGAEHFMFLERIYPDFKMAPGSTVYITVYMFKTTSPDETPKTFGPYTITSTTQWFIVRGRGKFAQLHIESTALGTTYRVGDMRARVAPAGRGDT